MATASQISRLLKKAGHARSEWVGSSRVSGWGNNTEGFEAKKVRSEEGVVEVQYTPGSWSGQSSGYQARQLKLTSYKATLEEAGFTVTQEQQVLKVTR